MPIGNGERHNGHGMLALLLFESLITTPLAGAWLSRGSVCRNVNRSLARIYLKSNGYSVYPPEITPLISLAFRLRCLTLKRTALGWFGVPVVRFGRAFCGVNIAIDHLKIWQAPIIEQLRPRRIPVFAPHPKQRDAVIHLGTSPQSSTGFAAASPLQAPQEPGLATRRIPELPCDHAGAVPDRILVDACVPQIDMPAEAINRLPAPQQKPGPRAYARSR
jgi:hypothetical protein